MDHVELPFVKIFTNAVTPTRVGAGVIDPDYMGVVKVLLINTAPHAHSIIRGDPIAQLILEKVSIPILKRVKELPPTARGGQGCGS